MAEKEQSSGFAISSEEIERLRQTIVKLEAENAQLTAEYQDELDAQRVELLELQQAYDQFEQASDLVLNDLEQKYERLRDESRHHSKRSML